MNIANNYVVIMAGGIGSRFWPFSRKSKPKQFHDVLGTGKTLIQETVERFKNVCPKENIYIVTNERYKSLTMEQLPFLKEEQVLTEPQRRNTAPCVAYAAYKIQLINPNASIVVAPSDHIIQNKKEFERIILQALEAASQEAILITLGIKPDRPATGYGYIQFIEDNTQPIKKVKTFTEKPTLEIAKTFLESGDFVWNAGIFIWSVSSVINGIEKHAHDISDAFKGYEKFLNTEKEGHFIENTYAQCPNISIDYGLMEHAENVHVLLSDFGWSDLGTWESLYGLSEKDEDQNVISGNVKTYDSKGCIIKTPDDKLVIVQGLEDYIIAENDGVLMICKKDQEEQIKDFVGDLKSSKGKDYS